MKDVRLLTEVMGTVNNFRRRFISELNSFIASIGWGRVEDAKKDSQDLFFRIEKMMSEISEKHLPESPSPGMSDIEKEFRAFRDDTLISDLIILARNAGKTDRDLIIALETEWIPGNVEGNLQHSAINTLMKEITRLETQLKSLGIKNIKISYKDEKKTLASWADELTAELEDKDDFSNVVIMGSGKTRAFFDKNVFAEIDNKNRAFIAEVDPREFEDVYREYGEDESNQAAVDIFGMLTVVIELAMGKGAPDIPIIVRGSYDKIKRTVVLLPKPRIMDYGELMKLYKAEKYAIRTAA